MLKHIVLALSGLAFVAGASAKLPDPTPEQKAAAALAAAKTAHAGKVDSYQLCMAQSKVADAYIKQQKAQGKVYTPDATPPCADPGPFVAPTTTPTGMTPAQGAAPPSQAAAAGKPAAAPAKK